MLTLRKEDEKLSLCCRAKIFGSLGDGVIIGTCSTCDTNVARVNPRTGKREWLNGASPWAKEDALPLGVHESDCAHRSDGGLYCLRPRPHTGLHGRLAMVWGDDGVSRLTTKDNVNKGHDTMIPQDRLESLRQAKEAATKKAEEAWTALRRATAAASGAHNAWLVAGVERTRTATLHEEACEASKAADAAERAAALELLDAEVSERRGRT